MISIIIPFHNEEKSLPILINRLIDCTSKLKEDWEVVFVDDGSTDAYASEFKVQSSKFKVIKHRKRLGKGEALKTGINNSKGETIVFMDADLQDDAKDIPRLIKKINEGYDFVNGIRTERKGNFLIRIYSTIATFFLKLFLRSPYTDINCGFKVFKRKVLSNFIFYGNNFRFFPLAAYYQGFKVTEISVINHPRKYGQSKFGPTKLFIGMVDTLTAYFLYQFSEKPLHFFGIIGGTFFSFGFLIALILTIERLFFGVLLYRRPALLLAILLIVVGVQIIMTGIMGELIVHLNKKSIQ